MSSFDQQVLGTARRSLASRVGWCFLTAAMLLAAMGTTVWALQKAGPPTREPPLFGGSMTAP